MVGDTLGTPVPGTTPGGVDGFLAQVDATGTRTWTRQLGTPADEQLWGVAADAAGNATVTGFTSGDLFATNAGDKDVVVARFDPAGSMTLHDQLGTIGNDKGSSVALDGAGNAYVPGFSDGNFEANVVSVDALLIKYGPGLTRQWARQFGTTEATAPTRLRKASSSSRRAGRRSGPLDSRWAAPRLRRRPGTVTCS